MFLSFCLLILCIIALFTKDNHRLYEKRNLTDLVKWIAAIAVVISHLCTFYTQSLSNRSIISTSSSHLYS